MLVSVDTVEKDKVDNNTCKNIRKSRNKTIKLLAKLKSQNLPKFKSENLFKLNKFQSISITKKSKFLTSRVRIIFIELRQTFTKVLIL